MLLLQILAPAEAGRMHLPVFKIRSRLVVQIVIAQTGGGVYNINGSPVLKNCLFFKNRSFINGAAMFNTETSNPNIVNCTFSNNVGIGTLAIASANTSVPTITNSIIWEAANALSQVNANPPVISYSIIKSGFTGIGNLATYGS